MKLLTGIILAVLAIAVVSLAMTTLAYSKRAQDVTAQLQRAQDELRELRGFRRRTPVSWEDSLRIFAGQQELPYPRFRGISPTWAGQLRRDDGGRPSMMFEQRERRRQALDTWFQQTGAALEQRARTADFKETAEVASQIATELAKLNALRPKWDEVRQMSEDLRRDAAQQLHAETSAVLASLQTLATRDRQIRLGDLARAMGQTDAKVIEAFIANVTGVYDESNYNPGRVLTNTSVNPPVP